MNVYSKIFNSKDFLFFIMDDVIEIEKKELLRLKEIVRKLKSKKQAVLELIYPTIRKRNRSSKVIVFSGSFNPFHYGHKDLIKKAVETMGASEALVFVTLNHSEGKKFERASFEERLLMLKMLQLEMPYLSVGLSNDGFYRNIFPKFKMFHPGKKKEYIHLCGTDVFLGAIDRNKDGFYPVVFRLKWMVVQRGEEKFEDLKLPISFEMYRKNVKGIKLESEFRFVSSTVLRKMIKDRHVGVLDFMSSEHLDFIERHGIKY